ncbi:MAG: hypothetical protein U5L11_14450 [Arhodomonas sp.]|nr:hypothetical protein [Arhodomonas sp.]
MTTPQTSQLKPATKGRYKRIAAGLIERYEAHGGGAVGGVAGPVSVVDRRDPGADARDGIAAAVPGGARVPRSDRDRGGSYPT